MSQKQYMAELEHMSPAEVRKVLDLKAQEMKNSVIFSPNYQPKSERVIYVSNSGSNANDGLSPEKPIETLDRVNEITLPGDTVLFKRGDHFRGHINVDKNGVTYASYGEGIKPIINSSRRNFADPAIWEATDAENVYRCTEPLKNAGLIHFDPDYTYGQYNELYGHMKLRGSDDFDYHALKSDLEFFCDRKTDTLYLYSENGNPGERFLDIEIGEGGNTFVGSAYDVTVDGLWIMHTGSHGVGSGTTKNRVVRNCIFSWLGGSMLGGEQYSDGRYNLTRYGNAVEIYGGCDGYEVINNWMYQIYDTAVTHQFSGGPVECHQHNVHYRNNLMEYCFWSIEYYNADCQGNPQSVKNVYMTGNFCRYGGYGWGCKGRESSTPMFCSTAMCDDVENVVAEHNILYQSLGFLVHLGNYEGHKKEIMRNNVYVNPKGAKFAYMYGKVYVFDGTEKEILKNIVHEEEPTVAYMPAPENRF